MTAPARAGADRDFGTPEFQLDPYPVYAALRDHYSSVESPFRAPGSVLQDRRIRLQVAWVPLNASRNSLVLPILGLLVEQPAHGYDITTRLRKRYGHLSVTRSTVTSLLKAVEKAGMVSARLPERIGNRPPRTVYELTVGRRYGPMGVTPPSRTRSGRVREPSSPSP